MLIFFVLLPSILVRGFGCVRSQSINRETGESPVQTRCCKLRNKVAKLTLIIATVDSLESWEGAWRWSKSEDLPKCYCFSEVLGNRTGRRFVDYVDDSHLWGELFLFLVCCPLHDVQGLLIISFAETSHN